MPKQRKKRKSAKSLSTLFDKAALHQLSSRPESANERMKRFFASISLMYNDSEISPKKAKIRKKVLTTVQSFPSKLNLSDESGIDPFFFNGDSEVEDISLEVLNKKAEEVASEKLDKYKKSITSSLQKQFSHVSSSNNSFDASQYSIQSPQQKQTISDIPDAEPSSQHSNVRNSEQKLLPQQDHNSSSDDNTNEKHQISFTNARNNDLTVDSPNTRTDNDIRTSRKPLYKSAKGLSNRQRLSTKDISSGMNCAQYISRCKFVLAQMNILKTPLMFGGILKQKFESRLSNLQDNQSHLSESTINLAIKRYNTKLLRYHHDRDEDSKILQSKAVNCLNQISELRDDVTLKDYWQGVSSNCAFECPDEIPSSFSATRQQHTKYHKLKSEIEKLQSLRVKKIDVMTSFGKMLKQLDMLKNATAVFQSKNFSDPVLSARYANKLVSTISDVQSMVTAMNNFLEEEKQFVGEH